VGDVAKALEDFFKAFQSLPAFLFGFLLRIMTRYPQLG